MDPVQQEKKPKANQRTHSAGTLRVKKETKRRALQELARAKKKDGGRAVLMDDIVSLALSLIQPGHIQALQDSTLTHQDRLDRDYRLYVSKHGPMDKDEYLGKRLSGEINSVENGKEPEKSG